MIDLNAFTRAIYNTLKENLPRESVEMHMKKHKNRKTNLVGAFGDTVSVIPLGTNGYYFEYGNMTLETEQPHYHILEDAEVIYKRNRGTETSKGSQAKVLNIGTRDYSIARVVTTKGGKKSIYQEYRKNVRGSRSQTTNRKYSVYWDKKTKNRYYVDVSSNYTNVHYHYIENIMNNLLPFVAQEFGLRQLRTKIAIDQELIDTYNYVDYSNYNITDTFEDDYSY